MSKFFTALFDSGFMPHGTCYLWQPSMVWLHAVADGLIALAYYSIPVALIRFARQRRDLVYPQVFFMFGAFILACGTTHAMEIWNIWHGTYRLAGLIKAVTAGLSLATAGVLWPLLPRALALPSPSQLRDINGTLTAEILRRERAEESLKAANATLAQRAAELARINEELRQEADRREGTHERQRLLEEQLLRSQKTESLAVLAGGIAHDFNNLMMVVLGNAELAIGKAPDTSPIRAHIAKIQTAALRSSELTGQLLAYAGRGKLETSPLELTAVVREMGDLLAAAIAKSATLVYDFAPDLPPIQGDATQLRQVVMNLITNASDAIGSRPGGGGGGTIHVRTGRTQVDASSLLALDAQEPIAPGPYTFLEVTDDGCGMEATTRARIFDPFFTTKRSGRGLGLAATIGIVRAHGGAVRVESEVGHGSRFTLFFPALAGGNPGEEASPSDPDGWRGRGTVLVVDDELEVREVTADLLEEIGFSVLLAGGGAQALDLLRQRPFDVDFVVLDLVMPDQGGDEVFRELRRLQPDLPVLLVSGHPDRVVVERILDHAATGFLQKPFKRDALARQARDVFRRDR